MKKILPLLVAIAAIICLPFFIAGTDTTEVRYNAITKQCAQYVDFQQAYITGTAATTLKSQAAAALNASNLKNIAIAQGLYAQDQASLSAVQKSMLVGNSGTVKGGLYEVIADDDTANSKTIVTGLSTITSKQVQIMRANVVVTGDAVITKSAGSITVADGSTYVLTTGDIIEWSAIGGL